MQAESSYKIIAKKDNPTESPLIQPYQQVQLSIKSVRTSVPIKHRIVVGRGELQQEIEAILLQMKKEDAWTLQNHSNQETTITIQSVGEIVDSRSALEIAEEKKSIGNDKLKGKDYKAAISLYLQGFDKILLDYSDKAIELKLSLISNLALAYLNSGQFAECVKWCEKYLEQTLDPNQKVVYRKASANKGLKNWQKAKEDIAYGIRLSGEDKEGINSFNKLLQQIEKEEKEQLQKEKKVYSNMFK